MSFVERVKSYTRMQEILAEDSGIQAFYFTHPDCGVCHVVKPNVEEMMDSFPEIQTFHIDLADDPMIGGQHSVFMVPALLIFRDGKEIFREAKYIVTDVIEPKIQRILENFSTS